MYIDIKGSVLDAQRNEINQKFKEVAEIEGLKISSEIIGMNGVYFRHSAPEIVSNTEIQNPQSPHQITRTYFIQILKKDFPDLLVGMLTIIILHNFGLPQLQEFILYSQHQQTLVET